MEKWEKIFETKIKTIASADDPAHDLTHFKRVVAMAKKLCVLEKGDCEVVTPAAWLHDFVLIPKDDPRRNKASRLSSKKAKIYLKEINYPTQFHDAIAYAIAGHSFSAGLEVNTIEAQIVQDADRLDGLGAIGLARCFAVAGIMKRPFYLDSDPFCRLRKPDDSKFTVDHFYKKLFKTAETLKTKAGQAEGRKRIQIMKDYLQNLENEIFL